MPNKIPIHTTLTKKTRDEIIKIGGGKIGVGIEILAQVIQHKKLHEADADFLVIVADDILISGNHKNFHKAYRLKNIAKIGLM